LLYKMDIFERIEAFFREQESMGYFLVEIKSLPGQRILIYTDSIKGISIDECSALHRKLIESLGEAADAYEITVSSPGLDEPFKVADQYVKSIGKTVDVLTYGGQKFNGTLTSFSPENISIEEHKKAETLVHTFELQDIKSTRLSISFKNHKQ